MDEQNIIGQTRYLAYNGKVWTIKILFANKDPWNNYVCEYSKEDGGGKDLVGSEEMFLTKEEAQKEVDAQKERFQYMPRILTAYNTQLIIRDIKNKHSIRSVKVSYWDKNGDLVHYRRCRKKDSKQPGTFYASRHHVYIHPRANDDRWVVAYDRFMVGAIVFPRKNNNE